MTRTGWRPCVSVSLSTAGDAGEAACCCCWGLAKMGAAGRLLLCVGEAVSAPARRGRSAAGEASPVNSSAVHIVQQHYSRRHRHMLGKGFRELALISMRICGM